MADKNSDVPVDSAAGAPQAVAKAADPLLGYVPLVAMDMSGLSTVLRDILAQLKQHEQAVQEWRQAALENKDALDKLKLQSDEQSATIARLLEDKDLKDQQINDLLKHNIKKDKELIRLKARVDMISPQSGSDNEFAKLQLRISSLEKRTIPPDVRPQLKLLQEEVTTVKRDTHELHRTVDSQGQRILDAEKGLAAEVNRAREADQLHQEDMKRLEDQTAALRRDLDNKVGMDAFQQCTADVEVLKRMLEELQSLISELAKTDWGSRIKLLEGRITENETGIKFAQKQRESQANDIRRHALQIDAIEKILADLTGSKLATELYADTQYEDLARKLELLGQSLKKKLAGELKIFERDLQTYLEDELSTLQTSTHKHTHSSQSVDMSKTAIGKTHFRCLTCSSVVQTVEGPMTPAMELSVVSAPHPFPKQKQIHVGDFVVESGKEVPLVGAGGQIFRGRTEPKLLGRQITTPSGVPIGLLPASSSSSSSSSAHVAALPAPPQDEVPVVRASVRRHVPRALRPGTSTGSRNASSTSTRSVSRRSARHRPTSAPGGRRLAATVPRTRRTKQ